MHLVDKSIHVQVKGEKLFVNNICQVNDFRKIRTIILQINKRSKLPVWKANLLLKKS